MRRSFRRSYVALDRANAIRALELLARSREEQALPTYLDILRAFADSPNGGLSIRVPMSNGQLAQLQKIPVRVGLVQCVRAAKWEATYTHPTIEGLPVITVRSPDRPKTRCTFSIAGHGRRRYERTTIHRIKESTMATRTRKGARSKKAAEVDELEGLEELEELEELDEVEEKPKRTRRTRKAKAEPEPEDDEDEEDEDENEDEDDEEVEDEAPTHKRRGRAPTRKGATKSTTKAAASKTSGRKPPPRRELPPGKVGPDVIADLAGVETRDVRIYLRKQEVDKDEETGRYAFTQKQAEAHAKRIKKARAA